MANPIQIRYDTAYKTTSPRTNRRYMVDTLIKIGSKAPEFELPSHNGDPIRLNKYVGEKNVLLSFHIYSFTGG